MCVRELDDSCINKSLHRDWEKKKPLFAHFCEELFSDASSGVHSLTSNVAPKMSNKAKQDISGGH